MKLETLRDRRFSVLVLCLLTLLAAVIGQQEASRSPLTAVDQLEGIWIEMDPATVTAAGGEIMIHNTTSRSDFSYGLDYWLEEGKWGRWYTVSPLPDRRVVVPDVGIHIPTAGRISAGFVDGVDYYSDSDIFWKHYPPNRMGYSWEYRYGTLPPGTYRLIIDVLSDRDIPITKDSPRYFLTAPFTIG